MSIAARQIPKAPPHRCIAVPWDVRLRLARHRYETARARYELNVRRGQRWRVPKPSRAITELSPQEATP